VKIQVKCSVSKWKVSFWTVTVVVGWAGCGTRIVVKDGLQPSAGCIQYDESEGEEGKPHVLKEEHCFGIGNCLCIDFFIHGMDLTSCLDI
jgi:hypothetical protein